MFKEKYTEFEQEGEDAVRRKIDQGLYAGRNLTAAQAWIKERERKLEAHARRWNAIRSWSAIVISALALLVSLAVAIFK